MGRGLYPVNEPLTTARFSALYGFWYPHCREEGAFWLALLNETDATRLSMRAIRRVNPAARLVQTDDLGFCHASAPLQAEADFQNERRWMGWDLLCGKVVPGHALWERLARFGFADRLRAIADDPCPPDVIGINHYLSSERLLDHRVELHDGRGLADRALGECNGLAHVDVDAIRSVPDQVIGLSGLIEQAWERYGLPIAVTECHNGSTRDEQARWFIEAWDAAAALRARGVDVRALTAWSLLGSYDWNRMVTTTAGHYEPGVFDVRGGQPRATLMSRVLHDLASGRRPNGPGLDVPGWWRNERRLLSSQPGPVFAYRPEPGAAPTAPLAILAGDDVLTRLAAAACEARGLHYFVVDKRQVRLLGGVRPWAVLDTRFRPNARLDLDDELVVLCRELSVSGACFARYDPELQADVPAGVLVVESAPVFTADDEDCIEVELLDAIELGSTVGADGLLDWSGVYGPVLVDGVLDLLLDGATERVHFVPEPGWSTADVARALAQVVGRDACLVHDQGVRGTANDVGLAVTSYLPSLESVLERFVADRRRYQAQHGAIEQLAEAAE